MKRRVVLFRQALDKRMRRAARSAQSNLRRLPGTGSVRLVVAVLIGFLLVAMVYLAQSSNAAMIARELRLKQLRIEDLKRQNAQLRYEIAALTSPTAIQVRALKMGLGPAKRVIYADLPWLETETNEIMPSFLAFEQEAQAQVQMQATQADAWEQFLARLGFGFSDGLANAQTKSP
jgi:hypothetical protein